MKSRLKLKKAHVAVGVLLAAIVSGSIGWLYRDEIYIIGIMGLLWFAAAMVFLACRAIYVRLELGEHAMYVCYGCIEWHVIPYDMIGGLVIMGAAHQGRYAEPILDDDGKRRAAVGIYTSDVSFLRSIRPENYIRINCRNERLSNLAWGFLFNEAEAIELLERTQIPIYISEEMLLLHEREMQNILVKYPSRVIVAYINESDGGIIRQYYDEWAIQRKREQ